MSGMSKNLLGRFRWSRLRQITSHRCGDGCLRFAGRHLAGIVLRRGGDGEPDEENAAAEGGADLEAPGKVKIDHVAGHDDEILKGLIQRHLLYTGSERARRVLENWTQYLPKFVKVMPLEYRRALAEMAQEQAKTKPAEERVALSIGRGPGGA